MKNENRIYLERFRHHYNTLIQAGYAGHIHMEDRRKMLVIAKEEFDPNYAACLSCDTDFVVLLKYVFVQMDKRPAEIIRAETFPKHELKKKNNA